MKQTNCVQNIAVRTWERVFEVWRKGDWYIAKCPELDFVSQGKTQDEARENLVEVIQIQFEEMAEADTLDECVPADGAIHQKALRGGGIWLG